MEAYYNVTLTLDPELKEQSEGVNERNSFLSNMDIVTSYCYIKLTHFTEFTCVKFLLCLPKVKRNRLPFESFVAPFDSIVWVLVILSFAYVTSVQKAMADKRHFYDRIAHVFQLLFDKAEP